MNQKSWIVLNLVLMFSLAFSYESKFSYFDNPSGAKINLSQSPNFVAIKGGFTRISNIGDGHSIEVGMPEIPHFTTYFQLDPEKEYDFELEIIDSYIIENIIIMPHQGMNKWEVDSVNVFNENIYNSYSNYPDLNLIVSNRSQGRGIEFVSINVTPYKYFPKLQKLEVYTNLNIEVIDLGSRQSPGLNQPQRSRIFDDFYKDMIVNFEYSDRPEDYQASSILYIGGGSAIDNSYVQDLVDWRHKQGYIVYTATEAEVGGNSASTSEIKNYISDAYFNWENPPEIVGLIGDTGGSYSLPNYTHGWGGYDGATDFDYTQLDGGDLIPEIFIGRISGSSSSDFENIINKTIQYEKATYLEDRFFRNAGLIGDPSTSGNSTIFTNQYIENIMTNYGMNNVQHDYDGNGLESFMEDQFNRGILYYNYRGWYFGDGSFPTNGINNGFDTPFVTTLTCGTGDFDGTSSSEEFVRMGSVNNPKGAVGSIGMATTGTHTAYNNIVNMGVYDGIFAKKVWYAGAAEASGDAALVATYPTPNSAVNAAEAFAKWSNLIGDPALHLWSSTPKEFNVSHPETILLGTTTQDFTIINNDNELVKNAKVTLLMGNDIIFSTGYTDSNGEVSLDWSSIESGTLSVMVMKRNYRPYEGTIEISDSDGAAVSLTSEEIVVNSGAYSLLNLELYNYGNEISSDLNVELSSESEFITLIDNFISLDKIDVNQAISFTAEVYIHGTAFHMEDIDLKLIISDNSQNLWISPINLSVKGPDLNLTDFYGNFLPGSSTQFALNIENNGPIKLENYSLELLSIDDLVYIQSAPIVTIEELFSGDNIYLDEFNLSFSEEIINGSIHALEVLLTSFDGYSRSQYINIMVGEVRETDPLGPDTYGYYIYDSNDIDYDKAPEYDWIEIAEGVGEQMSISDNGNGNSNINSSTDYRELPFTFTFYGIEYDRIQLNTNGWISFGDFQMNAFRNYPIPGAGGPSPMVAAFWDDLMTGSDGYVYYYASDDYVIIQWDNMRTCGDLTGGWYASNCSGGPRQTFEMILYPTNNIKIQYQDFNNSSDGNYPNGGTPSHGCYSTVGIENHLGQAGLEYSFNNQYSDAASILQDRMALFITNESNTTELLGDLNEDGILDVLDVVILVNSVLNGAYVTSGDINQDEILDVLDIVILVNSVLG